MTKQLKVRLENRGHGDFTIHLPALPPEMDGDHHVIFYDGERVIFGLMIFRHPDGSVGLDVLDANKVDPEGHYEFFKKGKRGRKA